MRPQQSPQDPDQLQRIRWLSRLLDSSIRLPGTDLKIGLDPIIGLIPGIGDAISASLSGYIIMMALSLNVSAWTLTRMVFNVFVETLVGAIPLFGDVFDAIWKSNERNRRLLEEALKTPQRHKVDRRFVVLILIGLVAMLVFAIWSSIRIMSWMVAELKGW